MSNNQWTQQKAIELCVKIEAIAPNFGMHVALSGGCLYKPGPRKDCDIILYRHKRIEPMDLDRFFKAIKSIGVNHTKGYGYCNKAEFEGRNIDFLCPTDESGGEEYPVTE